MTAAHVQDELATLFPPVRFPAGGVMWVECDPQQTTIERDVYVMAKTRASRLDGLRADLDFDAPEAIEGLLREILGRILESGTFFDLLAGLLVPEGQTWTSAGAAKAVDIFKGVTDADAKDRMLNACAKLVLSFFIGAVSASMPSPNSSEGIAPAAPTLETDAGNVVS